MGSCREGEIRAVEVRFGELKLGPQHKKSLPRLRTPLMSLYYEAASLLANPEKAGGSLKSRIYKQKGLKSSPAQLYALITEASKWSKVLKDVIEKCGLLAEEKKVSAIFFPCRKKS